MSAPNCFRLLARYSRIANERIYEVCAQLSPAEYTKPRPGSFGSIHALLNHILLGDRIWMARFESGAADATPPLNSILYAGFRDLRTARIGEDQRIVRFFDNLDEAFLLQSFSYVNNQGRRCAEDAPVALLHFFNHQTHHRGQVHIMLSQAGVQPPSLDLHRALNP